jgi:hypothetical protein
LLPQLYPFCGVEIQTETLPDSGIPRPKIFGHNAPESPGCRRPIGETAECSAATAIPGKNFRGASAKDKPGVPRIEENEHDIVVL